MVRTFAFACKLVLVALVVVALPLMVAWNGPRRNATLETRRVDRMVVVDLKRGVSKLPTSAWTKEEVFVKTQLGLLGKMALKVAGEGEKSTFDESSSDCTNCSLVPFYIDPGCAHVCKEPSYNARRKCWLCSHWATSVHSVVTPDEKHASKILKLPVLQHVFNLMGLIFSGTEEEIDKLFDMQNHKFASEGRSEVEELKDRLPATIEEGFAHVHLGAGKQGLVENSGSGGGMGMHVYCNNSSIFTVGGGGGQGMSFGPVNQTRLKLTFGGGKGAGFQVFEDGKEVFTAGGGAGGGMTVEQEGECVTAKESYGGKPDETNMKLPKEMLQSIRDRIRSCWNEGVVTFVGGGGIGGGLTGNVDPAVAELALRFESFQQPCHVSCLKNNFPDEDEKRTQEIGAGTDDSQSTCTFHNIQSRTRSCTEMCRDSSYDDCICPCFKNTFLHEMNCTWASMMECPGTR